MNCIDNDCKYIYSKNREMYYKLTKEEIPDNIDETQCDKFEQACTCINCKYSRKEIYETGTIDDIKYRCTLQNGKMMYDDLDPYDAHFADVPECNIGMFEVSQV